ncbi:dipeptidyl aminopeptidase/acylaminoacyl peptidase [Caulobacter rhizosphaerae]|uniref:Dipeptidyl aminopeptidase/acylaminoacyl peptidase n=1 Tax=Caulobacter rhizosphaerae TaxID=2010972 RepID=A0ABU1MVP8_9CAUL|nr:prolyl oligopeptidase family serine peptidase [Caulobacter rhizosphaerae]MDR6530268.1 dipeptidyl aminopeptidase/acylaminoacyl peptidase [Caulobacter rhizosphaerae]
MPVPPTWSGRLAAAWLALAASAAGAQPLTLDRLLKIESLGSSALSPDGRHLVVETERPYDTAARFDFALSAAALGELRVIDLGGDRRPRRLLPADRTAGYLAGPFSPNGRAMIVYRWKGRRWDSGVVDLRTGAVRWLGFGLDRSFYGRSVQWLSDTAFVAIALRPGDAPLHIKLAWQNQARTRALWRRQAEGREASVTVMGAGRARDVQPRRDRSLVLYDLVTGRRRALATGGFLDLEVSGSRRFVAALGEAEPIGLAPTPAVRMGAPGRRRNLTIVDLASGAGFEACARCTTLVRPMAWAAGSDRLLVYQHEAGAPETSGGLFEVDAATQRRTRLDAIVTPVIDYGGEGLASVQADWLGERPIVLARRGADDRLDWFALAGAEIDNLTAALPSAPSEIALVDDAAIVALTGGAAWRIDTAGSARSLPGGAQSIFRPARFGAGTRLAAAPMRGASIWRVTPDGLEDLSGHRAPLAPETTALALWRDRAVVEVRKPEGRAFVGLAGTTSVEPLLTVNPDLGEEQLGQVRTVEARGPDGRMLKHWLLLPPTWRPGQHPPLVVVPYPGSAPQRVPFRLGTTSLTLTPNAALLAAQGYAVLSPALPRDRAKGEPGEGLADQMLAAVDAVVAEGYADPDRLALWGHSFGGYAALMTATQTGRFKAIIAQSGPSDYVARWGAIQTYFWTAPEEGAPNASYMGYGETGQGALLGPPWRETDRYLRNSPLFQADKITTPLMLIYADQEQVPLSEGQAMFNALYRQDKDATLVSLFGEGHLPTSPANIRAIYATVLPWLADRLARPPSAQAAARASQ